MIHETHRQESVAFILESIHVADLPGMAEGMQPYIELGSAMDALELSPIISAAVKARFAPAVEQLQIILAGANTRIVAAMARLEQLKERLAKTPPLIPLAAPRPSLPQGIDRWIFCACVTVAFVVTLGDGLNASLLAARELQSVVAGLAFLLPALCAPLIAKASIVRLPIHARFWAELGLGILGLGTALVFVYQFVSVFTATRTLDEIAAGTGLPGMKSVYLATLALGFLVVYFSMSKALSMLRPGPQEQENPAFVKLVTEVALAEQELAQAQGELAAHQPRLDRITVFMDYLTKFILGAAQAKRAYLEAQRLALAAQHQSHAAAAGRLCEQYENVLGRGGKRSANGGF